MEEKNPQNYQPVSLDIDALAGAALDWYRETHKKTWDNLSSRQKASVREVFLSLIESLQESLATGSPAFLADCVFRENIRMQALCFPGDLILSCLAALKVVLQRELPQDHRDASIMFIRRASTKPRSKPRGDAGCQTREKTLSRPAQAFLDALLAGDQKQTEEIVESELVSGTTVREIYSGIFQSVLVETGRLWQTNKIGVGQEHFISAAILRLMGQLHDRFIPSGGGGAKGKKVVLACVGEELHEIGIRMVSDLFAMDGWDTYYVGANIPPGFVADAVKAQGADIVALSVTMPSRLSELHYLIRSLRAEPATAKVRVIVGGNPFHLVPGLWKQVGADVCASGAEEAVEAARRLLGTGGRTKGSRTE